MGKYVVFVLVSAVLSGCASDPISKNLREQSQPVTFIQAKANPGATRGTAVVWGGRIIKTVNDANGSEIYVLELPLGCCEKPCSDDLESTGRFIVRSPESLDPATYPRGGLITVAGDVAGDRTERLENIVYVYPLLDVKQAHVWAGREHEYDTSPGWYWSYAEPD